MNCERGFLAVAVLVAAGACASTAPNQVTDKRLAATPAHYSGGTSAGVGGGSAAFSSSATTDRVILGTPTNTITTTVPGTKPAGTPSEGSGATSR